MKIPAITTWQPWAGLIICGFKPIENRGWSAYGALRGKRVAIHGGKTFDQASWDFDERIQEVKLDLCSFPNVDCLDRGAVLGTAVFVGEVFTIDGGVGTLGVSPSFLTPKDRLWWERDRIGMIFRNPIPFPKPIPTRGHQGIWYWEVPAELEHLVIDEQPTTKNQKPARSAP